MTGTAQTWHTSRILYSDYYEACQRLITYYTNRSHPTAANYACMYQAAKHVIDQLSESEVLAQDRQLFPEMYI